jgi:hypothetical protein
MPFLYVLHIHDLQVTERDSCSSRLVLVCRTAERQFLIDKLYPDPGLSKSVAGYDLWPQSGVHRRGASFRRFLMEGA